MPYWSCSLGRFLVPAQLRLGVVGLGSMGSNHVRTILENPRCTLARVVDVDLSRAAAAAEHGAEVSATLDGISGLDAVMVASSTESHSEIATELLERGIPTFVEKPMATSYSEVMQLVSLSERTGTPLACGFVERFSPVVSASKDLIPDPVIHVRTQRSSPPASRHTSNAIWDLLLHDLDLTLGYLGRMEVESLSAAGFRCGTGQSLESVEATYRAAGAVVGNMCSRMWQRKVRSIEIATATTLLELDLLRQTITTYRNISQEQISDGALIYRSATTIEVPFVRHAGEPLALELDHFLDLVVGIGDPQVERMSILAPHALAEAIQEKCA